MKKRLLSILMVLCLAVSLVTPVVAVGEEPITYTDGTEDGVSQDTENPVEDSTPQDTETTTEDPSGEQGTNTSVARIGPQEYDTLDAAVAAATDGTTIELLANATTNGLNLSKNLTIQAATGLEVRPTVTFNQYGIALWGKNLTFKNIDVEMNGIGSTPYTGEWSWMTICASANASLTLDNVNMTMDATGTTNSPHAIYFCNNNVLNIINGSNLTIKNYGNDALEWDGGDGGYNVNITDSTFVSDHNRSGFTGTFYATITNSKVDVINSTGNGSNGSHFIITDSTVNFNNNGSHGLSAGELKITNSTVTANNNRGMGITVNNAFAVENSTVTVTGNAVNSSYGYAAVRLYNNYNFSVDKDSKLYIKDNNNTGLYVRQGNLTVADGAVLEITGNKVSHMLLDGYGGGIYVGYGDNYDPTVTIPGDAKIYNNHSLNGGDDIYVSKGVNGPMLTFGPVGTDWRLDGDPDCEHLITGWFDDSENARWDAHTVGETHVEEYANFVDGNATVTGLTALKAAHGLGSLTVQKVVASSEEAAQPFTIQVSMTGNEASHTETLTLCGGESNTISIPIDASYTVTETDSGNYTPTYVFSQGTITETDSAATAVVVNVPKDEGALVLSKTVNGEGGDLNKDFTFTVTFDVEGSYPYTGSKTGEITSGGTVTLKNGESISINNLPEGTTYTVTETAEDGYTTTISGDDAAAESATIEGNTASGTIVAGAAAVAHYTNTHVLPAVKNLAGQFPHRGLLVLSKLLAVALQVLVMAAAFALVTLLAGRGFWGDRFYLDSLPALGKLLGVQYLLHLGLCALVLLLTVVLRGSALPMVVGILACCGVLVPVYGLVNQWAAALRPGTAFDISRYMLDGNLTAVTVGTAPADLLRAGAVGAVFVVVCTALAMVVMEKRDIR